MLTLEGEPTGPSFLKTTLRTVDLLIASPDVASVILDLISIIDQVSADYTVKGLLIVRLKKPMVKWLLPGMLLPNQLLR